jgi:hypothetical protein
MEDDRRKEVCWWRHGSATGGGFGTLATLWWRSWLLRAADLRLQYVGGATVAWPTAIVLPFANGVVMVLLAVVVWWPISHATVVWLVASIVSCAAGTMQVKTYPFLG